MAGLDALAYSSFWVALAAGALCSVAAQAMSGSIHPAASALAVCGTLVVYNVDRLRDLEKDRVTAPARSAFVTRHRTALTGLAGIAALASLALGAWLPRSAISALLPVLVVGLLHRRLKRFPIFKPLYVALAWVVVTVLLPAVLLPHARAIPWVAGVFGLTILANVIACNLRDGEAASASLGEGVPLRLARVTAASGALVALAAPPAVRGLVVVPLATVGALIPFHAGERYGHIVVDGALLLGALGSLALL